MKHLIVLLVFVGAFIPVKSQESLFLTPFETTKDEELKHVFSERIQSATIVGLGESTHFTKECYDLKLTLIQQLIEEGFDALVLEVDFGQALKWNRYVVHDEGNLDSLISSSGWFTYRTEEFKRVLHFIHEHNLKAKKPFQIFGMEMTAINYNLEWMHSFLAGLELKSAVLDSVIRAEYPSIAFQNHTPSERLAYWRLYQELETLLSTQLEHKEEIKGYETAMRMVEIFRQYATYVSQDDFLLKVELRDQFSSRNVLWALEQCGEEGRIGLWAHNGHVAFDGPMSNYTILGTHLKRWFGEAYYSVGFTFNKGEFGAFGPNGFEHFRIAETDTAYWTNTFINANSPFLFVDVRSFQYDQSPFSEALRTAHTIRTDSGESFNSDYPTTMSFVLGDTYDALIYFNNSHTPTSIPWQN